MTQKEVPFPRGETIVSKTDLKGVITYANDTFVKLCGFSREELLGQAHNIIRHPDMPPEAFADLWKTINSGQPWAGVVKNRCKNGDHYWVKALIVPVRDRNRTVGHMSVRTEPAEHEKRSAAALYQAVRNGQAKLSATRSPIWSREPRSTFVTACSCRGWCCSRPPRAWPDWQGWTLATALAGAIGLVPAAGSYWFMAATVANPLEEAIAYFDQIAQGNLRNEIPVNRPDEVGRVLAGLAVAQTHMRVMIDEIRLSTEEVEQRCKQLDQQLGRVTGLSRDQAERIAQISEAMGALSSSVTTVAQTAETSADSARSTLGVVDEGNQRMTRSIEASGQVVAAVQASGEDINLLSQSIDRIGTMTGIVKEIADQTNLLALNAAIEAARAGEQGRGFAVVADEVRKLAERTSATTADIDRMVESVQATARSAVATMDNAVQRVQQGRAFPAGPGQPGRRPVTGLGQRDLDRQRRGGPGAGRAAVPGRQERRQGLFPGHGGPVACPAAAVRGRALRGGRGQHERHDVLAVDCDRAAALPPQEPVPGPVRGGEARGRRVDVAVLAAHRPGESSRRHFPQRAHDPVLACVLDAPLVGIRSDGLGEGDGIDAGHHVTLHSNDVSQSHRHSGWPRPKFPPAFPEAASEQAQRVVFGAAHRLVVEGDAADPAVGGQHPGLRLDLLGGEDALHRRITTAPTWRGNIVGDYQFRS